MLDNLKIRVGDAVEIIRNEGLIEFFKRLQAKSSHRSFGFPKNKLLSSYHQNNKLARSNTAANSRGRILVIDALVPMPDRDSGSQRMMAILRIARELGYDVSFIASNCEYQEPYASMLEQLGIEILSAPYVSSVKRFLNTSGNLYKIIWISRAQIAAKYLDIARQAAPDAMIIFDTVDLQYVRKNRLAEVSNSETFKAGAAAMKKIELNLVNEADATVVVSQVEKQALENQLAGKLIEVVSNIHEDRKSVKGWDDRSGIIFLGCFRHPPNVDAVYYFVKEILPEVRNRLPDVITYIVGSDPPAKIRSLASDDTIVTGYVPDITGYLERSRVSVAPLRYGAGVKGKINTAMTWGIPVVTTSIGAEGMYLENGVNALIADDPVDFANDVIRAYNEKDLWERLSANGIRNVHDHFSTNIAEKTLERLFDKAPIREPI